MLVDYITEELAETETDFFFINQSGKTKGLPMRSGTVTKLFEGFSEKLGYKVHPRQTQR